MVFALLSEFCCFVFLSFDLFFAFKQPRAVPWCSAAVGRSQGLDPHCEFLFELAFCVELLPEFCLCVSGDQERLVDRTSHDFGLRRTSGLRS